MFCMILSLQMPTDSCSGVLQRGDVAALVTYLIGGRAGQQGRHRPGTAQLNTPAPRISRTLRIITKRHPSTLLPSQIKDITIKVTIKIKVILEVNSKAWKCSRLKTPMRRNAVERLSMHLLRVPHREKRVVMESLDDHRWMQGQIQSFRNVVQAAKYWYARRGYRLGKAGMGERRFARCIMTFKEFYGIYQSFTVSQLPIITPL